MKKRFNLIIPAMAMAFVVFMASFSGSDHDSSGGSPGGYTNSPADGKNCSHCMGGTATPVDGWLSSDVPGTGYVPGQTYTITVVATGSGRKGFQISPQDQAGNLIGLISPGTGNKIVDTKYITHSAAVLTDATWLFQWQAPAAGAGAVTFYASRAIGKTNTQTSTLTIQQSTVGMPETQSLECNVFPNPARSDARVSIVLQRESQVAIDLLDMQGRLVKKIIHTTLGGGKHLVPVEGRFRPGLYLLRIEAGGVLRAIRLTITG